MADERKKWPDEIAAEQRARMAAQPPTLPVDDGTADLTPAQRRPVAMPNATPVAAPSSAPATQTDGDPVDFAQKIRALLSRADGGIGAVKSAAQESVNAAEMPAPSKPAETLPRDFTGPLDYNQKYDTTPPPSPAPAEQTPAPAQQEPAATPAPAAGTAATTGGIPDDVLRKLIAQHDPNGPDLQPHATVDPATIRDALQRYEMTKAVQGLAGRNYVTWYDAKQGKRSEVPEDSGWNAAANMALVPAKVAEAQNAQTNAIRDMLNKRAEMGYKSTEELAKAGLGGAVKYGTAELNNKAKSDLAAQKAADAQKMLTQRLAAMAKEGTLNRAIKAAAMGAGIPDSALQPWVDYIKVAGELPAKMPPMIRSRLIAMAGVNPEDLDLAGAKADTRATTAALSGIEGGNARTAVQEETLKKNIGTLRDTMASVPDFKNKYANVAVRKFLSDFNGDPRMAAFEFALKTVQDEAGRLLATGGSSSGPLTVHQQGALEGALSKNGTMGQVEAALQIIEKDTANRVGAGKAEADALREKLKPKKKAAAAAPQAAAPANEDAMALAWAQANPTNEDAKKILALHGVKP